jgi:uncharacterized protein YkwD
MPTVRLLPRLLPLPLLALPLLTVSASAQVARAEPSLAEVMLAVHNRERALVGTPPLRWNAQMAAGAADYAAKLVGLTYLEHSPRASRPGQGENLSLGAAGFHSAEVMAGFWVEEKKDFVNGAFDQVSRTGNWLDVAHYTQMIWRTTTEIGCAVSTGARRTYLVCRYSPKGNRDGQKSH